MIYDVGNSVPGLGQAQKCGGVKPVNMFYIIVALAFLIYFRLRKYFLNNSTMKREKEKQQVMEFLLTPLNTFWSRTWKQQICTNQCFAHRFNHFHTFMWFYCFFLSLLLLLWRRFNLYICLYICLIKIYITTKYRIFHLLTKHHARTTIDNLLTLVLCLLQNNWQGLLAFAFGQIKHPTIDPGHTGANDDVDLINIIEYNAISLIGRNQTFVNTIKEIDNRIVNFTSP